jgi:hypothetical protein
MVSVLLRRPEANKLGGAPQSMLASKLELFYLLQQRFGDYRG